MTVRQHERRFVSIRSNRHESQHFQHTLKAQLRDTSLRKSTSGITNLQQGERFVTIRPNRIESTTFLPTPEPSCAFGITKRQQGERDVLIPSNKVL